MKIIARVLWVIFFILAITFIYCSKKELQKEFMMEKDLDIGMERGDERYVFAGIQNIALDSEERIYVLDRKNYKIQKFDKEGNFLKGVEIKKGQGPEEVSLIFNMAVTRQGKIYVQDNNRTKILVFDEEENFLQSFNIMFRAINIIPFLDENLVVLGLNNNRIFHVFDTEGDLLHSFGEPFEIPSTYSQYKNFPQISLPIRADWSKEGNIFLVNLHMYEIRVYENKVLKQVIKHDSDFFSPLMIKPADEGRISMVFPWVSVLKHRNRIYVNMKELAQENLNKLDVFENDVYISSLETEGFAYAIDEKGRLYFAEEKEFPKVVRYLLKEK